MARTIHYNSYTIKDSVSIILSFKVYIYNSVTNIFLEELIVTQSWKSSHFTEPGISVPFS
jgi:hypothetical protein